MCEFIGKMTYYVVVSWDAEKNLCTYDGVAYDFKGVRYFDCMKNLMNPRFVSLDRRG